MGQGPGEEENDDGRPFVGKSGQLLRLLCDAAGIPMSLVYRENAVRCWSGPGNRKPTPDEVRNCRPYLIDTLRYLMWPDGWQDDRGYIASVICLLHGKAARVRGEELYGGQRGPSGRRILDTDGLPFRGLARESISKNLNIDSEHSPSKIGDDTRLNKIGVVEEGNTSHLVGSSAECEQADEGNVSRTGHSSLGQALEHDRTSKPLPLEILDSCIGDKSASADSKTHIGPRHSPLPLPQRNADRVFSGIGEDAFSGSAESLLLADIFASNTLGQDLSHFDEQTPSDTVGKCACLVPPSLRTIITLGETALSSVYGVSGTESEAYATSRFVYAEAMTAYAEALAEYETWKIGPKAKGQRLKKPVKPKIPKPPKVRKTTLKDIAGHTLIQEETGIPIIPSYYPAFLMRGNWEYCSLVIDHFRKALRIVEGEQKVGSLGGYTTIKTVKQLQALRDYLLADSEANIFFDSETTGLRWQRDELLCISLSSQAGEGFVVPILHKDNGTLDWFWPANKRPKILALLKEIFGSPNPKCGHNLLFDLRFLERSAESPHIDAVTAFDIAVKGQLKDTELMHLAVSEGTPHNMTSILASWTDCPYYETAISAASGGKKLMAQVEDDVLWAYSAADADGLPRMEEPLMKVAREEGTDWVLEKVTYPMLRVCRNMEERGFPIDQEYFDRLCAYYTYQMEVTEEKLWEVHPRFRWWVPSDMSDVLFKQLHLPVSGRKTDGAAKCLECLAHEECDKHDATGAEALKEIYAQHAHPIIPLILELKSLKKVRSTYLNGGKGGWLRHIKSDGRIHPSFKMNKVETGRLASSDPNAQNEPKGIKIYDDEVGIHSDDAFRDVICASEGRGILNADWSSLELWVMAYCLDDNYGDSTMLDLLLSGQDIHTRTARLLWPVDPDMLDSEWRRVHSDLRNKGKTMNFGINYGLTPFGTAERLHCTEEEAAQLIRRHIESYPALGSYLRDVKPRLLNQGYSENKFGRRRHGEVARILQSMGEWRALEELIREHINFVIQSGGSDMHSIVSVLTDNFEPLQKRDCNVILSVHDSLMFDFAWPDDDYAIQTAWMIKSLWENAAKNIILKDGSRLGWQVPVEIEFGRRWGSPEIRLDAQGKVTDLRKELEIARFS